MSLLNQHIMDFNTIQGKLFQKEKDIKKLDKYEEEQRQK